MSHARPRVVAVLPGFIPSTVICVVKPLMELHREKQIRLHVTLEGLARRKSLEQAELVVFCRNTEPKYSSVLEYLQSKNIPFIYDIDDNFFQISAESDDGKYHSSPERIFMLTRYIQSASLVRVYSESMWNKTKTLNGKIEKVVGPVDFGLIGLPKRKKDGEKLKIVYATSRLNDELSGIFMPALARILDKYRGRVEAHFWGPIPSKALGYEGVHYHPFQPNYEKFLQKFSEEEFDIGLAPLKDDEFHRSKTDNKFREYGACGIAGIYSSMAVYLSCISEEETGLLVPNEPQAWYHAISRLIADDRLRDKIRVQALSYVRQHYSEKKFEEVWWNQIRQALDGKERAFAIKHGSNMENELEECRNEFGKHRTKFLYLAKRFGRLSSRVRNAGVLYILTLLRHRIYQNWMLLKLRYQTSDFADIFFHSKE